MVCCCCYCWCICCKRKFFYLLSFFTQFSSSFFVWLLFLFLNRQLRKCSQENCFLHFLSFEFGIFSLLFSLVSDVMNFTQCTFSIPTTFSVNFLHNIHEMHLVCALVCCRRLSHSDTRRSSIQSVHNVSFTRTVLTKGLSRSCISPFFQCVFL